MPVFLAKALLGAGKFLASVPWYVWALVLLAAAVVWEHHEVTAARATVATLGHNIVVWRDANSTNARSVHVLLGAVTAGNAAVSLYAASMAKSAHLAAGYKAAAAKVAAGRAKASAILAAAPPIANDCAVPAAHALVAGQL